LVGYMVMPPADVRARVLAEVSREPALSRGQVRVRNAALLASGVAVPVVVFLANGGVRVDARPQTLMIQSAIGAGAVALTAVVIALGRGRSMLGRSGMVLLGLALVTPIAMLGWKLGISSQFLGMMDPWPERPGFRCLQLSCLMAAWPLVAIVMTRGRSDPIHPRLTGAAIGAAVGACSWVFVDLWCPVAYVPHLLLGHVLPLVLTTAAGTWLGRFVALRRR
jgi:hypothetical protein